MTRIIGGRAGGRRLRTPPGSATRPTSDRVREALFSAVESRLGSLVGLRVLDLYAGSGALGLEAWSRGAAGLTLVEQDRRTARLIAANAREIGCDDATVVAAPVASALRTPPPAAYDLVMIDPPYAAAAEQVAGDLGLLVAHAWLTPGALVVVERGVRTPDVLWPAGIEAQRQRRYGETMLWYGRADPPDPPDPV